MRTMTLLLCLALAGCVSAGNETTGSVAGAGSPGRFAQANARKEDWWKDGGVTREKINAMCWMKYETGRKDMPVEKRADLVNACVVQTLKEHPVR